MLEPDKVSAILRLNELGCGAKRTARELGISRNTAKDYIAAGGWTPCRQPQRKKALDGQEGWLLGRQLAYRPSGVASARPCFLTYLSLASRYL
jgi:hypothetical protein